ncbi:MAG: phosphatase PAP2 family protein, partial [Bacteroidetes bacterium]|nr:phosphatase PAP2 family protein [Bacteroidota bacterium]
NSFPSGHTTSAFALATILALHATKKGWGVFFLLLAVGVAYSRIYLGQHFLPDVTMGAILGTVSGLLVYAFVNIKLRRRTVAAELPEETAEDGGYASNLAGHQ